MEQENHSNQTENDIEQIIESQDTSRGHSSHGHSSHHHHHSGSGHRGSHSSHRNKHSTSQSQKTSAMVRMQKWVEKTFSHKTLMTMSVMVLLVMITLLGGLFWFETAPKDEADTTVSQGNLSGDPQSSKPQDSESQSLTIPSYWGSMIKKKTQTVKALQAAGGKDSVSFVWASDTHIPDNSTARTNDIGKLMAVMMNNCDISFAVLTGDIGTRGSTDTEAELVRAQEKIPVHLAPLWGTDRLLVALGNHDGCFGDSSCYYKKQFSPERMWDLYFRNQAMDSRRVFSEDGLYYYVDNTAQKTRFIVLNSQYAGEYLTDGNGIAVNNRFATSCYGQQQLDWLADVALDMPEGYGAVITAHVPPNVTYTVDKVQLIGIINAYCKKTTYQGSYTAGVDGWSNNSVSVDFTQAKGEIIAMFAGHVHEDTIDTTTLACPLITIISAGAQVNTGEIPERVFDTDTETSFDVVTINRKTRTIYLTRIGWGEDRVVKY